jgi:hypothetical protein
MRYFSKVLIEYFFSYIICLNLKGKFYKYNLKLAQAVECTGLKFSPNGKYIVISTNGPIFYVYDAFNGQVINTFVVIYLLFIFFI